MNPHLTRPTIPRPSHPALPLRLRFAPPHLPRSKEAEGEVDLHLHAKDVFERERGVGVSGRVF